MTSGTIGSQLGPAAAPGYDLIQRCSGQAADERNESGWTTHIGEALALTVRHLLLAGRRIDRVVMPSLYALPPSTHPLRLIGVSLLPHPAPHLVAPVTLPPAIFFFFFK